MRPLIQVKDLVSCSSIDDSKANLVATQNNKMLIPTLKTLSSHQNHHNKLGSQNRPAILLTENSSEAYDDVVNIEEGNGHHPVVDLGFQGLLIQSQKQPQSSRRPIASSKKTATKDTNKSTTTRATVVNKQ